MKKLMIITSCVLLAFGTTLTAQDTGSNTREDFMAGIKAGLNYSNVWDAKNQDYHADNKLGLAAGIFASIPVNKFVGFQPEILISQKGFKGSGTLLGTPHSFTRTTTFIDVPLQLQIKPTEFISVVAGPQYSYLLSKKDVHTFGSNSVEQSKEFENDNIRKNIFGFVFGADINVDNFVVSGRLGWDLVTNNGDGTSSTPRYKNQWLQLTAGFRI